MMTEIVLTAICAHYKITRMSLTERVHSRSPLLLVEAKQTAVYCLWRYTRLTADQIKNILGYTGKSTVNMARKKVKEILSADRAFAGTMQELETKILRD